MGVKTASVIGFLGLSIMPASSKVLEDRSPAFAADKMKQRSQMGELPVLLPLHSLDLGSIAGQRQMEVLRRGEPGQGGGGGRHSQAAGSSSWPSCSFPPLQLGVKRWGRGPPRAGGLQQSHTGYIGTRSTVGCFGGR